MSFWKLGEGLRDSPAIGRMTKMRQKKHAAPPEPGLDFGLVVAINMALLAELSLSPTPSHPESEISVGCSEDERIPLSSNLRPWW